MKILFLDESGDHNLLIIDKEYPVFVLGGCIIDEKYYKSDVVPSFKKIKKELFGTEDIILHFRDYARSTSGFEKMRRKEFREEFYAKLGKCIDDIDMTFVACIIDKKEHKDKYDLRAQDPYLLSMEILVEKFVLFLKDVRDKGTIIAESRNPQLDNELNLAFLGSKISGTRFFKPKEISENITDFYIKKKEENIVGLQIADSMVTPVGRKYLQYKDYLDFSVIERKFRKNEEGKYLGYGLVILPKKIGRPPHWQ